ncbi:unnamed protein product [Cylicocyclus nassatus]|uniref:Uncharacterized protein n=1 Tax=Cylicocyclus nassatus TaxID=53992 RepID=A0AA36M8I3_CYLNA|nr:unnamed protein product [Cylicocyclus nassatus]
MIDESRHTYTRQGHMRHERTQKCALGRAFGESEHDEVGEGELDHELGVSELENEGGESDLEDGGGENVLDGRVGDHLSDAQSM